MATYWHTNLTLRRLLRCSAYPSQVVIDADTRQVVAVGTTGTVIADGGYHGAGLAIPYYRRYWDEEPPPWKGDHNASHRKVRARVDLGRSFLCHAWIPLP